ncbi:MAG: hypothetical protein RJA52_1454, partial [Bacteroidota bacterium]
MKNFRALKKSHAAIFVALSLYSFVSFKSVHFSKESSNSLIAGGLFSLTQATSLGISDFFGNVGRPYIISNSDDLKWLADSTNGIDNWSVGKYFIQTADIVVPSGFAGIGSSTTNREFQGNFDGGGFSITGLNITSGSNVGLFGTIKGATIYNVRVRGSVSGASSVGGLVGQVATGAVSYIYNCNSKVIVNASSSTAGGLVGNAAGILYMYHSSADSSVSSTGGILGGAVGDCKGCQLVGVTAKGKVETTGSSGQIGGLVGLMSTAGVDTAKIINGYATGNTKALANSSNPGVGGLIGEITGDASKTTIVHTYANGKVEYTGSGDIGGLIGKSVAITNTASFWDSQTTMQNSSDGGGMAKNTTEMTDSMTFRSAGWDYKGETTNGTSDYWGYNGSLNGGYPFLFFEENLVQTGCNVNLNGFCFSTIKAAFDSINTGNLTGSLVMRIDESTVETSTAQLNAFNGSLLIYPGKSGISITGNINAPLVLINGADSVTIDGRVLGMGFAPILTIENTATGPAAVGVQLNNAATNNTVKYTTIKASTSGNGAITVGGSSGNNNNRIEFNRITSTSNSSVSNGIFVSGSSSGNQILNNEIFDIFGIDLGTFGIRLSGAASTTIRSNRIFLNDSITGSPMNNNNQVYGGIRVDQSTSTVIDSNRIFDITLNGGAQINGIYLDLNTNTGTLLRNNSIYNLDFINAGNVTNEINGIFFQSTATSDSITVFGNFIHNLKSSSSSINSAIHGLKIAQSGGRVLAYNNIISLGTENSSGITIRGVQDESVNANNRHHFYYNTVYIGGTATGQNNSASIWLNNSTPSNRNLRNNIFANFRSTVSGDAKNYGAYIAGSPTIVLDNNNYYSPGTNGFISFLTTDLDTISAMRIASRQDCSSQDVDPMFVNAGSDSAVNYSILYDSLSAVAISGITTDFFGDSRSAMTPTMGSFERSSTTSPSSNQLQLLSFTPGGGFIGDTILLEGR